MSDRITLAKNSPQASYSVFVNHTFCGTIDMLEDGFYQFFPELHRAGYWPSWMMREIADEVEKLNSEWEATIERELGYE